MSTALLAVRCLRATLQESADAEGHCHALRRIVSFDAGGWPLEVSIDISTVRRRRNQCTRITFGSLYAMQWKSRCTHATPRWPALSWAATLAVEMRVGELRTLKPTSCSIEDMVHRRLTDLSEAPAGPLRLR